MRKLINRNDKELTKISFVLGILGSTCVWAVFFVVFWVLGYFIFSKSNCNAIVNLFKVLKVPEILGVFVRLIATVLRFAQQRHLASEKER